VQIAGTRLIFTIHNKRFMVDKTCNRLYLKETWCDGNVEQHFIEHVEKRLLSR